MEQWEYGKIPSDWYVDYPAKEMEKDGENGLFWVARPYLEKLEERLQKLNRKAERMKMPPISYDIDRSEKIAIYSSERAKKMGEAPVAFVDYVVVDIVGEAPQFAGWEFQATVQPITGTQKAMLLTAPGIELPNKLLNKINDDPYRCDHCQKVRRRNETFVIFNESKDKYLQVGRSCVRDFLGHKSPQDIAKWYSLLESIVEDLRDHEVEEGGRIPVLQPIGPFFAEVLDWFQSDGYQKGMGLIVLGSFYQMKDSDRPDITKAKLKKGEAALEVIKALLDKPDNQLQGYEYNVKTGIESGYVEPKTANIIGSAVLMWSKAEEVEKRKGKAESQWIGKVGERLKGLDVTCVKTRDFETQYGWSMLYVFLDEAGNEFKWFGGVDKAELDGRYKLDGTVKKHEEYQGKKSTALTRCKPKPV